MSAHPKVSILIPTYGQQDYICDAIASALAQIYSNLEVIVVDDASPDQTAERVASFRDPRLRYVRNAQNLGRVKNYRHALYDLATGEWVVNLDGDDYFIDSDFIDKAVELAYSEPGIVIVSAHKKVATSSGTIEPKRLETAVLTGKEVLLRYNDQRYHISHMATLYHRPSALDCDFYRMDVISSDWESLLRLALKGKVAYLDRVVGCWILHGGNASLCNSWRSLVDNLKIWESIYGAAEDTQMAGKALESARYANLLLLAYRDLSQIFKGGGVFGGFAYLYHGFPILKARLALRILLHPYIWAKCGINICKSMFHRISG